MPNHCFNILSVTGDSVEVDRFRSSVQGKSPLDMNCLIPMPKDLQDTSSPNRNTELAAELMEMYGASDWYDWTSTKWGTKWNFYNVTVVLSEPEQVVYQFSTAWCPIHADAFTTIASQFPYLVFRMEYEESGMGFMGTYSAENGILTECLEQAMPENYEFAYRSG